MGYGVLWVMGTKGISPEKRSVARWYWRPKVCPTCLMLDLGHLLDACIFRIAGCVP